MLAKLLRVRRIEESPIKEVSSQYRLIIRNKIADLLTIRFLQNFAVPVRIIGRRVYIAHVKIEVG